MTSRREHDAQASAAAAIARAQAGAAAIPPPARVVPPPPPSNDRRKPTMSTMSTPSNQPEPTPTRADIERMTADNDAALQALATQGIGIDQGSLSTVRLGMLVEHLLGDLDDPRRLAYEHALQQRYATLIADVKSQVTRQRLLQGVQLGNNGRPA